VHNAAKFSPAGATIELRAAAVAEFPPPVRALLPGLEGPCVEVQVIDEGSGIAPGDVTRIFEPFQQGKSSLRREHGGVGLGLPICRGIVRSHGGEIWAETRPEGGSLFRVVLPRGGAAGPPADATADGPSGCRALPSGV
jgi:two-component system sensor histidine kinase KdpD